MTLGRQLWNRLAYRNRYQYRDRQASRPGDSRMKIEGVVISCYRFDLHLTRLCVASLRFWYPEIPIWLLKDSRYGDFSTREIESYWNVQVYPSRQ